MKKDKILFIILHVFVIFFVLFLKNIVVFPNEVFGNSSNGSVYLHFCHRKDLLGLAEFLHGIPLYAVSL